METKASLALSAIEEISSQADQISSLHAEVVRLTTENINLRNTVQELNYELQRVTNLIHRAL